ncbi:Gmad2 immunoglobulin-like domain-containing protein [Nocardioides alcanivorans]|uniref:Gmad2 immunoglobulin-like domain-containing protein n=1 Tax=Nocardioides alcanivorans TaxID=2897352 RepID=UPI001F407ED0|nr:Gmad2 immunoglobulin-like domain-containing protein [Nocardioides alcanivorans]
MNQHDDEIRRLLNEAVGDVEPHEGITTIKSKTKEKKMSARRPVLFGAGGAAIATAAVIGVIAWSGGFGGDDKKDDANPAGSPTDDTSQSTSEDPSPTEAETSDTTSETDEPVESSAVAVYYVGDAGRGPVLYREFQSLSGSDKLTPALEAAVVGTPNDPDYRSAWPDGTAVNSAEATSDLITVDLGGVPADLASGVTAREAKMALQQLVYTAQAANGEGRVPVQITLGGSPSDTILGVPTAEPLNAGKATKTLSLMSISSPSEGATVSGSFTATGVNNGFEAWVGYQILKDGEEVASGFGTAEGWMDEKLFPWEVEIDVSDLEPGEYVLRFHNDDPSGGAEGSGPDEDTRTIVVE